MLKRLFIAIVILAGVGSCCGKMVKDMDSQLKQYEKVLIA